MPNVSGWLTYDSACSMLACSLLWRCDFGRDTGFLIMWEVKARTVLVPEVIPQCSIARLDSFELSASHGMAPKTGWRSCLLCFHFAILWVPKMVGPSLCHRSHVLSFSCTKTYHLSFLSVQSPMGTWWVTWGTCSPGEEKELNVSWGLQGLLMFWRWEHDASETLETESL